MLDKKYRNAGNSQSKIMVYCFFAVQKWKGCQMENTNKSKRYLINASYGACAEAEQFFPDGGKDVLPDTDRYAAAMRGTGGLIRIRR